MTQSEMCFKGIFYMTAFLMLTHCLIAPVIGVISEGEEQFTNDAIYKNDYEPLTLHKRPSFFVGSRYGRSGGSAALSSSKTRRLSVVPRNDRFFLGSRYGKRSEEPAELYSPYEQENQLANNEAVNAINGLALQHTSVNKLSYGGNKNMLGNQHVQQDQIQTPSLMTCVYTGLRNFFRCRNIDEINNIINQLTIAHSVEERK